MSSSRDHTRQEPCAASRPEPPHSPHRRDVTLHPPQYVPLDAEHERQALDVLADMLAHHLEQLGRSGAHENPDTP